MLNTTTREHLDGIWDHYAIVRRGIHEPQFQASDFPVSEMFQKGYSERVVQGMYGLWVPIHTRASIGSRLPNPQDRRSVEARLRSRAQNYFEVAQQFETKSEYGPRDAALHMAQITVHLHHFSVTADQAPLLAAAFTR